MDSLNSPSAACPEAQCRARVVACPLLHSKVDVLGHFFTSGPSLFVHTCILFSNQWGQAGLVHPPETKTKDQDRTAWRDQKHVKDKKRTNSDQRPESNQTQRNRQQKGSVRKFHSGRLCIYSVEVVYDDSLYDTSQTAQLCL